MTALAEYLSVEWLASAYRRADSPLSPLEVTEFFLDRIERFDGELQSMVTVTADLARRQAVAAAERIAQGDPNPLLGIPVVLKDLIDVEGVRTTAGSEVLRDNVATASSAVWSHLESAGAVLLGKSNTHEFAYGGTTEPTVNPWDLGRLVGGSSGGPGAALGAGLVPVAVGSDTAGSIRIPANLCGVYGFKPTNGTTSAKGVIPLAPSLDSIGPMGHSPGDLALIMGMIDNGRFARRMSEVSESMRDRAAAQQLRIAQVDNPGALTPGAAQAYEHAVSLAATIGEVSTVHFDGYEDSVMANFTVLGVEAVIYHEQFEAKRDLYSPYVRERLEQAAATNAVDYEKARRTGVQLTERVDQILESVDVVVLPGVPYAAPPLGATTVDIAGTIEDRDTSLCRNTGFANLTGHPVLAMPIDLDNGLPVEVQLVAKRGHDAELLAIGAEFARRNPIATVAPKYAN